MFSWSGQTSITNTIQLKGSVRSDLWEVEGDTAITCEEGGLGGGAGGGGSGLLDLDKCLEEKHK